MEINQLNNIDERLVGSINNMRDPNRIKEIMLDPRAHNPDPYFSFERTWNPLSLAEGYPGVLVLLAELNRHNIMDVEDVIHQYVLAIKERIESQGLEPDLSLYNGVAGICFALHLVSAERLRYRRMLTTLEEYLFKRIRSQYLEPLYDCLANDKPVLVRLYDPIMGITGIGRYLLENFLDSASMQYATEITQLLIRLTRYFYVEGKKVPGWYVSNQDPLNVLKPGHHSLGNFNLGLAHGVTGILAYLSIATLRGIDVEGQKEAIKLIANWLQAKSFVSNETLVWSTHVSFEGEVSEQVGLNLPSRDAWCYGTPGVSRTLYLAGKAIQDQPLKSFAIKAFQGVFQRTFEQWDIPAPTLCHGIAGLLTITQEMAKEDAGEDFSSEIQKLKDRLYSAYQDKAFFGFKDIEPCRQGGQIEVDKIGYLEGSVGTILSLLPLSKTNYAWHLPLLIA